MLDSIINFILVPFVAISALFTPAPQTPVVIPDLDIQAQVIDQRRQVEDLQALVNDLQKQIQAQSESAFNLGATFDIPTPVALFEDSLASSITANDTSFTLVSGQDVTGTALASSTYGFIIDEGQANEEFVLADCTGTTCINATRGVSPITGTSSVTALKKAHRRGASVKITDSPIIPIISSILNGESDVPNIISYKTSVATTSFISGVNIVNKAYVDDVAFSGASVINASESARGVVELAVQKEMASSSISGGSGPLVLQAKYATSSDPLSGHYIPVTKTSGDLDEGFFPTSRFATTTWSTSTLQVGRVGSVFNIGKSFEYLTTPGTSTYSVPPGINQIMVHVVGAGGDGGSSDDTDNSCGTSKDCGGGGGGAGGYSFKVIDVSSTSTINYHVGDNNGDRDTYFGQSDSKFLQGKGGNDGAIASGGVGGVGSLGDFSASGQGGSIGNNTGGTGGSSYFGGGAAGTGQNVGQNAVTCGAGGSGATADNVTTYSGGDGADGCIIIIY